jgi:transposase
MKMRGSRGGDTIETLGGRSEAIIGDQSRILNWPGWRDGTPDWCGESHPWSKIVVTRTRQRALRQKEVCMIPAVVTHCAGIDIGKRVLAVCLMVGPADAEPKVEVREFSAFTADLEAMKEWLLQAGCTHVVMESTGPYWKPVFNVLEGSLVVCLANAEDVKGRKGHKTDRIDAQWLAHLLRHDMIRASFVPPRGIRELRDLTRRRKQLLSDATSERNRVQKTLEDANVKLGSVLSDVFGVSGQRMLEALLDGHGSAQELAQMAQQKARHKIPQIIESLAGHRFSEHHRFMIRMSLDHLRMLERQILALDEEVLKRVNSLGMDRLLNLLQTIPGLGYDSAVAILAEVGPDVNQFPTAKQLSSWAGLCPGNKKSAGKDFRGRTTRGNRWLRSTLTECAWAVSRSKKSPLRDKFWRWAVAGKKKAVIAVAHGILVQVYQVMQTQQPLAAAPPPPDEKRRQRIIRHHLRCLGRLGISTGPKRIYVDGDAPRRGRPPRKAQDNLSPGRS